MCKLEDNELIRQCLDGEVERFGELVRRYERMVRTMISRVINDDTQVEELAHQAFIQAYEKLDTFAGRCKFSTWLGQIALNKARDYLRSQRTLKAQPTLDIEDAGLPSETCGPDELASAGQQGDLIQLALAALKAPEQTLIVLRYIYEYDYGTIAGMLHSTRDAVKVRSFRARAKLRDELVRMGLQH